ncbi:MAG: hypothetical protein IJN67_04640 [Oscillospiraceae bacterium]|nr:hypothetical protein [Oscillospiraceae bacterium]
MATKIKRYLATLLMLVLVLGMLPCVNASAATTQTGILLFDYSDNGDYTSRLNSQIAVTYKPNGTGSTKTAYIKNLGWHFARYGNVPYADDPLYCIEPYRSYAARTSGNSVDRGITVSGSGSTTGANAWYSLPENRREAIGLILLYSDQMWDDSISVTTTTRDNNPNVPLRVATQFLIYEIVCGLRDPDTFALNATNESGTDGDIFYNAGAAAISDFAPNYNQLVANIQAAMKRPSFTGSSSSNVPTITLTGDETSVTDSNGVLSNWSFTDGNGAEFYKSGNTLYITQIGTISESTVFKATRSLPSAYNSTFNLWYMSGSSYQTTISLASASTGTAYAYFKLDPPDLCSLDLTKATEDGENLSGWQFGIYSNSTCTSLVSGPHTTNSSGKISVSGLTAGTYYVKELGHTDSSIDALYYCSGTNPQKVTISAGGTAAVSFTNKLNIGNLSLTKTTEDNKNLSGWQFGIYSNSACTTMVSGPHTTDSSGNISVTGLFPGTYYVKENGHTDSNIAALYTCASTNPQEVTISVGKTVTVSFHNVLNTGSVKLVKETNTGENLAGWQIGLYFDSDCTQPIDGSPFVTGADGTITISDLEPGTLYAKEIPTDDPYWEFDTEVKKVSIAVNQTATVTFTNTHYGRIAFRKTTNTGNHLGGWTFRVQNSNYDLVGEYTTDESGYACTENLPVGRYTVIELQTDDLYWNFELGFHDVTVVAGEDTVDEWLNREQGLGWFYKQTNTDESVEGWHITIYADEACTQELYTVITNEDGRVGYYMDPGIYWAKETGDEYGRFEDEYWLVDKTVRQFEIKPHEDVSVTFSNTHYGQLQIVKTVNGEGSVAGWLFKVIDSSGAEIDGSPFTSDENGEIKVDNILPGVYTVQELIPEGSFYYCTSENPQTITVKAGETAQVSFTNAMRHGQITIEKVDSRGEPLAGAKFMLQWSEDGSLWWPIEYYDTLGEGKCSNSNIEDGCLTSGKDGLLEWPNLHPGLYYRVMELEAPEGYTLLSKPAFEGKLPGEELTVSLRVVNCEIFTLPQTGSSAAAFFRISQLLCICICSILLIHSYRKERK